MNEIPDCFYRISVKALVLNEARDKFLITLEDNGKYELPGGGLDWNQTPQKDLPREIDEEMGLKVTRVADNPSYFFTCQRVGGDKTWIANILYETELENLDFTPSDECVGIKFVNLEEVKKLPVFSNVLILAKMFKPELHQS